MAAAGTPRKRAVKRTTAPATEEPTAQSEAVESTEPTKIRFKLEAQDETKNYAPFSPPADSGCVGKLYVPKGTEAVHILLVGPGDSE